MGVEVSDLERFFTRCQLRDLLDAITVVWTVLLNRQGQQTADQWLAGISRILDEENLGYFLDPRGGVHRKVDAEFQRNRLSAIGSLDGTKYRAVLEEFESAHRALDSTPPDGEAAMRAVFEAVEILAGTASERKSRDLWRRPDPPILRGKAIKRFISDELLEKSRPVQFRPPIGARASGYRAETLPDVCEVYLRARDAGVLLPHQKHVAKQAEILVRALAHVGIIALVDEATGYQHERARDALARILEAFIAKELQAWVQTFPADFYAELFRLRGLRYPASSVKRP